MQANRGKCCPLSSMSPIIDDMNRAKTTRGEASHLAHIGLKVGAVAVGLVVALLATLRELFASVEVDQTDERQLYDSDLSGELNYRTGRLDSGTDPFGWYDRD